MEEPIREKRTPFIIAISWILVIAWLAMIFFMSSRTDDGLSADLGLFSTLFHWLKDWQAAVIGFDIVSPIAHFLEYTILGALMVNLLRLYMPLRRALVLAVVLASAYGVTDEFHQYFVPGRMSDPLDWLVDTFGATLGAGIATLVLRRTMRSHMTQSRKRKEGSLS